MTGPAAPIGRSLLPLPGSVSWGADAFPVDLGRPLTAEPGLEREARWWREAVGGEGGIALRLDRTLRAEEYRLRVTADGVTIAGGDPAGVFYALQTLRQMLPPEAFRRARISGDAWRLPAVEVADGPRFRWRGCMLDVARHFMPKDGILRLVDLLAAHKLNVLHLHLTDDQGWRLEVPGYPRLTEVGAWRAGSQRGAGSAARVDDRPHGGFYRLDDLREIVAYAAGRHVTVVAEVDLPGHTQAVVAAYPELGNGGEPVPVMTRWGVSEHVLGVSEAALGFCRTVLDVVCAVFPSTHVGIGGDEVRTGEWRTSAVAQERMRALGLPDVRALQRWFTGQLAEHLAAHGRIALAWDEVLETGAPAGVTIGAWRGPRAAVVAARAGHPVVNCSCDDVYFDYRQSDLDEEPIATGTLLPLSRVYRFQPVPADLAGDDAARILGAQCQLWTEHLDSSRAVDYMAFPRLCAFAETVWCDEQRDFEGFRRRLADHVPRLDALGVEYRPESGPLPWQQRPDAPDERF
jgi:hexosaminidase